jgi:uncharacterized protein
VLLLKPSCEHCDTDLPPESTAARICSYECTFCADCSEGLLGGICPNCGGNLVPRPIRPTGLLKVHPPSEERVHQPVDLEAHRQRLADSPQ